MAKKNTSGELVTVWEVSIRELGSNTILDTVKLVSGSHLNASARASEFFKNNGYRRFEVCVVREFAYDVLL